MSNLHKLNALLNNLTSNFSPEMKKVFDTLQSTNKNESKTSKCQTFRKTEKDDGTDSDSLDDLIKSTEYQMKPLYEQIKKYGKSETIPRETLEKFHSNSLPYYSIIPKELESIMYNRLQSNVNEFNITNR